jgi:hypothetical protein
MLIFAIYTALHRLYVRATMTKMVTEGEDRYRRE